MRPALLFPCLLAAALAAPTKFNGINFLNGQWSPDKYNSSRAGQALATLQSTTSTSYVALTFCWFQKSVDIPGPIYRKATSPTDEEIAGIVSLAHSKGISVMMRPGVDPVRGFERDYVANPYY